MTVINDIQLPDFSMKLSAKNQAQYALALTAYLKNRKKSERDQLWHIYEELIEKYSVRLTRMLNKDEVLGLSKEYEIGAHSYSHESMAIEGDAFFKEDFAKCKEYFSEELNVPLNVYAFPSGSYTHNQIGFLQANGVEHILLVNEKYADYNSNVYNRFTFYGSSASEIKMRALGWTR